MYKKQLRFQKIICIVCIIAAAIMFLYSLGMLTDIYEGLYSVTDPKKPTEDGWVPGASIYYQMQAFNTQFVNVSVGLILLAAFMFVMNTQIRRKYYIGNYVAIGLFSVASVATVIWSHINIVAYRHQYLTTVDFDALKEICDIMGMPYVKSTFMLDLHYAPAAILLLAVAALVGNMIWKIVLMRGEKKLLAAAKEVAV